MATGYLQELARSCVSLDQYYFNDDANRLYPAFGFAKIEQQSKLRSIHQAESKARLSKSLHQLADLTAQPEKEADWAIIGGLSQGIGGVGAGIAAAAQTQINNMAVRERNAKRAADAYNMHNIADNLDSIFGGFNHDTTIGSGGAGQIGVRLGNTDELFSKLHFDYSFSKDYISNGKNSAPIAFPVHDHGINTHNASISVSTTHHARIDGYVAVEMQDSAHHPLWEKVIPLPMLGAGLPQETSSLTVSMPKAVQNLVFHPIALWELTDSDQPDAHITSKVENIPNSQDFQASWQNNLAASNSRNEALIAKRRMANIRLIAIGAAIIFAIVFAFAQVFIKMNHDSNFDLGCIDSYGSPAQADREYFSKLPKSYHERVAEEYLDNARSAMDGYVLWESAIEFLNFASRYAQTDAQQNEIQRLYAKAYIHSNEEGLAEQYFTRQYKAGALTADQLVEYAQQMHAFEPDYSYETNRMQADALKLVNIVKDSNALAAQLSTEWDQDVQAYAAAIESFKARDYAAALAFFADHTDVEYGWEYYGFSKAATDLFGTWEDGTGNTLTIQQDPGKELVYWTSINPTITMNPEPYEMPLSITYNGKDISYCEDKFWSKGTKQCILSVSVYQNLQKVAYDMRYVENIVANPYWFDYNSDDQTLTVTHRSEAYKSNGSITSNVLWTRTFTRAD